MDVHSSMYLKMRDHPVMIPDFDDDNISIEN